MCLIFFGQLLTQLYFFLLQLANLLLPLLRLLEFSIQLQLFLPQVILEGSHLLTVAIVALSQLSNLIFLLGCLALKLLLGLAHQHQHFYLLLLLHFQQHFEVLSLLAQLVSHQFLIDQLYILLGLLERNLIGLDLLFEPINAFLVLLLFAFGLPLEKFILPLLYFVTLHLICELCIHLLLLHLVLFRQLTHLHL